VDVLGIKLPAHQYGWTSPSYAARNPFYHQEVKGSLPTFTSLEEYHRIPVRVTSGNHTLTIAAYVEECMEEGDKEACL
jgi:hypothetical protein